MSSAPRPFGDCKNAVLQNIGTVQAGGVLVAVHAESNIIEYCSENSAELLGSEPEQLLGLTGSQWLSNQWQSLVLLASREGKLDCADFPAADPLLVAAHKQGAHRIFEFERGQLSPRHWWNHSTRTRFVEQLTAAHTIERCRELLVSWIFDHSGYDRALMYRFLPEWDGEVVVEQCRPGVEGFLGLRFPAADIPPNARQMFTLNRQRAIVDVESPTAQVLPWNQAAKPLDLTYSILRSAHPVHLQYLKNMGVQASFTLALVVSGKLWALIACHHLSPRALPWEDRLAFEEMGRLVSLHASNVLGMAEKQLQSDMHQQLSRLKGALSATAEPPKLCLPNHLGMVRQAFSASGAWLRLDGEDFFAGLVPDKLSLAPLRDFLEQFPREQVSHYKALPEALKPFRALSKNASGVLFVPLGSADFIALVRPEVLDTVNWAGKPQSQDDPSLSATRSFTPRSSFASWSQRVRDTAEPWTDTELDFGEHLRIALQQFLSTARLEQIALHDPLTGLANRLLFERRLQQEVRVSIAQDNAFGIYMIDLDRFKQVNDTLGHAAGDQLLREVASRLNAITRKEDTVARLGGDEFAILQTNLNDRALAVFTADRIVKSICPPYEIAGKTVEIGASVGVSIWPLDTVEQSELLECADLALYQVKRSGRNAYSLYAPDMRITESHAISSAQVMQALSGNQFTMNYQPIVDARSGELRGLEAFLRWQRPGMPILHAGEFMATVETNRLGPAVGDWVLDAVFRQYQQWLREGLPMVPVAINIGNEQFSSQDLRRQIEKLGNLYETGWQWLRLDIKEQALVANTKDAVRKLDGLREAGIGTNLDNFGCGLTPLGFLTQLPFRGIKMDAVLFARGNDRPAFNALFNVVQSIAHIFSAQLTVTKIETQEMRELLRTQLVDRLQGHAIAAPADAAQAAEWLRNPQHLQSEVDRLQAQGGPGWVQQSLDRIMELSSIAE